MGSVIKIFHYGNSLSALTNAMKKFQEYVELLDETLVLLSEAPQYFPVKVSRPSLERLWRRGQRGVVLKAVFLVGRRYTSAEEIRRFLVATQRTGDLPSTPVSSMPGRDLNVARKKFNTPTPGKDGIAGEDN